MQEKEIYKYALYNIDNKECYQYLPTSNIEDVIYVNGMRDVQEKSYIKDGDYFIEINTKSKTYGVGEKISSSEIAKRYYARDPILQKYDKSLIDHFNNSPDIMWTLFGNGDTDFGIYDYYVAVNKGSIVNKEEPHNIVKGETHWYLELYHEDGTISYEKTVYDDRKYRGQQCNYYRLVKVLEYELEGNQKKVILEKSNDKLSYHSVLQTELDDIIDSAKGFISNQVQFNDFAGVSLLYPFNTEDSACVFHDHQNMIKDNIVTTVTGSGDAILDLFLYGAKKIIAFDTNIITKFYGELKFVAAKYLSFEKFSIFFGELNEDIYKRIVKYLSDDCQKFWNELYLYSKIINEPIRVRQNYEKGGLFMPETSMFLRDINKTIDNDKSYYNEENYLKLQKILQSKSLEDIYFANCDLFDLPDKVDLSFSSYVYLSNIMDFIIGKDKKGKFDYKLNQLKIFKEFILTRLLPALKENANIDLSYINMNWHHKSDMVDYMNVYQLNEGFILESLTNNRDKILSFKSSIALKSKEVVLV